MNALSPVLRSAQGNRLLFWCPGCDIAHIVRHGTATPDDPGPRWHWNGNVDQPSFEPSILVQYPWGNPQQVRVCHSFVKAGTIQFLSDCTHALAGKTVPLPAWAEP